MPPRSRPYSEIVQAALPVVLAENDSRNDRRQPFDVKSEYKALMKMLDEEKSKATEKFWMKLPYRAGYLLLLLVLLGLFCRSVMSTYGDLQRRQGEIEAESDMCLIKYTNLKCDLSSPTDECQKTLNCIKRK